MREHLLAVLVVPARSIPGISGEIRATWPFADRRQRVLVVHARVRDLDEDVALAEVALIEVLAHTARDPVVGLLRHERPHRARQA